MTRRKARIQTFEPLPSFQSSAGSSVRQQRAVYRDETTTGNDHVDFMRSLRLNDAYAEPHGSSQPRFLPLYRDATGVPPSFFAKDGNIKPGTSSIRDDSMGTKLYQSPYPQDQRQSQHVSSSASTTGLSRPKPAKPTFHDMLPPGFPIPQGAQRKTMEPKTKSSKPRVEPLEGAVQPVSATKLLRSSIGRPKHKRSADEAFVSRSMHFHKMPVVEPESEPEPPKPTPQTCQVQESEKVTECLTDKFYLLQQQSLKAIAKAWIKAICPKKQAHYPYSNKRKRAGTEPESIPPWWPPIHLCRYKEPDHIYGVERVNLLIHLIRLRPSQEEINRWSEETRETEPTSMLQPCGDWAKSLKAITPITIFSAVTREPQSKVERRPHILNEIFSVADQEEQLLIGGIDGTDLITWVPHPEARPKNRVYIPQHVVQDAYDADGSVGDDESMVADKLTPAEPRHTAKRLKREVTPENVVQTKARKGPKAKMQKKKIAVSRTTSPSSTEEMPDRPCGTPEPATQPLSALQSSSQQIDSSTSTSLTTSFDSNSSADSGWSSQWYEPRQVVPAGTFDYHNFRQYSQPQDNLVFDLPTPQVTPTPLGPYPYGVLVERNGHSLPTHLKEERMEDLNAFTMAPYLSERVCSTPAPQVGLQNPHRVERHLATPAAPPEPRMALDHRWQPPMFDTNYNEQMATLSDLRLAGQTPLHTPMAMHAEQHWHSAWNPQWDRPHGLPSNYEGEEFINYDAADAAPH